MRLISLLHLFPVRLFHLDAITRVEESPSLVVPAVYQSFGLGNGILLYLSMLSWFCLFPSII